MPKLLQLPKILYKEGEIKDSEFVVIRFINDGTSPIQKSDFDSDIEVIFSKDTKLYSSKILKTSPKNLKISLINKDSSTIIQPTLINPTDEIILGILISNSRENPNVQARISGIKELKKLDRNKERIEFYKRDYGLMIGLNTIVVIILFSTLFSTFIIGRQLYTKLHIIEILILTFTAWICLIYFLAVLKYEIDIDNLLFYAFLIIVFLVSIGVGYFRLKLIKPSEEPKKD